MPVVPRPEVLATPTCPHGVLSAAEAATLDPGAPPVLDFSANCNPLGAAPVVRQALATVDPSTYPPDGAPDLRAAIAHVQSVDPGRVLIGAGSTEILWLAGLAYLRPGDEVLILGPTFGEMARVAALCGARVTEVRAEPADGFAPPVGAVGQRLASRSPRLLFVCNPNNPTGAYLERADLEPLVESAPDTLVIVDEAYAAFVDQRWDSRPLLDLGNVLLLRSLTKDRGLAGPRLGYALAAGTIIDALDRVRPPWNVSSPAIAAGLAALAAPEHVERGRRETERARQYLSAELARAGLEVVPSRANFLLVRVDQGADFRRRLLARGICVRDCASFGLPEYVRIGMRTLNDCRHLVHAVRSVMEGKTAGAR